MYCIYDTPPTATPPPPCEGRVPQYDACGLGRARSARSRKHVICKPYEAPRPPSVVGSIGRLILTLPLQGGGGAAGGGGKSRTLPLQGGGGLLAVAVKQTLPLQGGGRWRLAVHHLLNLPIASFVNMLGRNFCNMFIARKKT